MADITVKFRQGDPITFTGAPDSTTQIQAYRRIMKDYPERAGAIVGIEGAKPSSLGERLKDFATEAQIGEHGVLTSDLPQLLYGVVDSLTLGKAADSLPAAKTQDEQDSRSAGREILLAAGPKTVAGSPMLRPPAFSGGSWTAGAQARSVQLAKQAAAQGAMAPNTAQSILNSPTLRLIAKAAGVGGVGDLIYSLYKHLNP